MLSLIKTVLNVVGVRVKIKIKCIIIICDPLRRNHPSALFHDIQFVTSSASLTLADHGDIFRLAIGLSFAKLQRPECNTRKIRNTRYKRFAISPLMNSVHKHLYDHSRPANM